MSFVQAYLRHSFEECYEPYDKISLDEITCIFSGSIDKYKLVELKNKIINKYLLWVNVFFAILVLIASCLYFDTNNLNMFRIGLYYFSLACLGISLFLLIPYGWLPKKVYVLSEDVDKIL